MQSSSRASCFTARPYSSEFATTGQATYTARAICFMAVLVAAAFVYSPPSEASSVYRWTDEQGVVHYGDRKPSGRDSDKIKVNTGSKSGGSPSNPVERADELNKRQEKALEEKAQQLKDEQQQAATQERCKRLAENIQQYKISARLRVKEDNGEIRYLSPDEKDSRLKQMEEDYAENC